MILPSFSKKSRPFNRSSAPEHLIIPTKHVITDLHFNLARCFYLDTNLDSLIDIILTAITYEDEAQLRLTAECWDLLEDMQSIYPADSKFIVNQVYKLGDYLLQYLRQIRAYRGGYLFYQARDWVDMDLVMVRLQTVRYP